LWAIASGADTDTRVYVLHGKGDSPSFDVLSLSPTLWLDASDETSITESGGSVSQWDDKSGNGYNLTQGTGTAQPATGTRTVNGLNVLDFDGSDYLTNASITTSQPASMFVVCEFDSTSGYKWLIDGNNVTDRQAVFQAETKASIFAGTEVASTSGTINLNPQIWAATFDGASSSLRIDGQVAVSGDAGTNVLTGLNVGAYYTQGTYFLDGAVAEIIIVDGSLTAQQIADTETYLAAKWGITI
jgi:hypothetical protein